MRSHAGLGAGLLAAALLLPAAAAQVPYAGDARLFLHRDGSLDALAPGASDDAALTFGLAGAREAVFETAPLAEPWELRGPAFLHLTFRSQASVLGRFVATLRADGEDLAASNSEDVLVDVRPKDAVLAFPDLRGTVGAGRRVALAVQLMPLVEVAGVALTDLRVEVLYDSTAHPASLQVLGREGALDGADGGPSGPAGTGSPGSGGARETGRRSDEPVAPLALAAALDPFVVMAGVGTSAVCLVAGLALRGRSGLG